MKILYIAHEAGENFNGASRSLVTLIKYFIKKNDIYVLLPESGGYLEECLIELGCNVIIRNYYRWIVKKARKPWLWLYEKYEWRRRSRSYNQNLVDELSEWCKKEKIDIIHSNSSVVDIGVHIAQKAEIPHVWHFREFAKEDFSMYPLVSKKIWKKTMSEGADRIIAVSNAVRKKYLNFVSAEKIITVYNGIDMSSYVNYEKNDTKEKSFNIIIAGLLSEAKGQRIAIKAVSDLIAKGYVDIHLYLAGRGDKHKVSKGIKFNEKNIHFLGNVNDMLMLRKEMDLELVCSKSEAFGRVTIEAMASQLPVIGTKSGGTEELIQEGINGYLVEYGDVRSLEKKIIYLYENYALCKRMGQNAKKSVFEKFTLKNYISGVKKVYESVLNNKCV